MYEPRIVVGRFFEKKVMQIFQLVLADTENTGETPDLVSRDGSFFVEVKASAYDNGGVVKRKQLYKFDANILVRRFYAFAYHPITSHIGMQRNYPTENSLKKALRLKSLYLFPFSMIKAHFEVSGKRTNPRHGCFVQLREGFAESIFRKDPDAWKFLGLEESEYRACQPHEKVHIVTRQGHLEQQLLSSFQPEFV